MGKIVTKLKLTNSMDVGKVAEGTIKPEEVRSVEVEALVDTGARRLALPEELVEQLGVERFGWTTVTYADNRKGNRPFAGPITIEIGDRMDHQDCLVLPLSAKPLIGQLVLEGMDLVADCTREELMPAHPDEELPVTECLSIE